MRRSRSSAALATLAAFLPLAAAAQEGGLASDYPTSVRADYVFGCMAANGQTREALERCSCSIDVIASILPHDRYVQAETVLAMRQGVGFQSNMFRGAKLFDDMVAELRRAQAEAEIRCFK